MNFKIGLHIPDAQGVADPPGPTTRPIADLKDLFELVQMPIAISAPEYPNRLLYVNDAYCRLTGYDFSELVGKNPGVMMQRDHSITLSSRQYIRNRLNSYERIDTLVKNYRKDGTMFWSELHVYPVIENGKCIFWIGAPNDVTARIQAASAELERFILALKETFSDARRELSKI